jgi:hypothetical protein
MDAVFLLLIFFSMILILIPFVVNQLENPNSRASIRNILPFSALLILWAVLSLSSADVNGTGFSANWKPCPRSRRRTQ